MAKLNNILFLTATVSFAGCSPFVPVTDMSKVSQQDKAMAATVQVYHSGTNPPKGFTYISEVEANSCKHMLWDAPSSMSNALLQLKYKAMLAGANAVMEVACTASGTDTYGTDCWNSWQCGGTAIKLPN